MDAITTGIIITVSGSVINFVGTQIYNLITGKKINFLWKNEGKELSSLNTNIEFEELKKRTRIVVIDDEDHFPVKLFQSEGYSIDKWDKVEDYGKLEKGFYDIIVLDIKGIAKHISEDDGLGVLEALKRNNPSQIIMAFSQHSFDLDKSRFWEMADEKIAKPSDFLKIKKAIDNLIKTQFKPERYISTIKNLLKQNKLSQKDIRKIETEIVNSITKNKKLERENFLKQTNNNVELVTKLLSLTNVIFKFFQ